MSILSMTFSFAMGAQKLGQPVPDSNLVSELKSAVSQQMQRNTPLSCTFRSSPVPGVSVPARRVISKEEEDNSAFHSESVFRIIGTDITPWRTPASVNSTIVTCFGGPLGAASTLADSFFS